jgi:membrane protease subunit HflC
MPTILVGLAIVLIIVFMMCAYQVRFTETVVVTRFDQIRSVVEPSRAGLHFKLPWPVEQVHRFDTRLQVFNTEFRQIGTEDQKTIILEAYATWRIADGELFLKAIGQPDGAASKIRDLLENRVSVVLRTHPLSHLVNVEASQMKFSEIEREIHDGVVELAAKNYGIELVSVGIKRLGIPASVTKEVFTRMKEDRQKTIKELTAEGEAKAKQIRVAAEEIAGKIRARAEAYAKKIEGQGEAEAAKYYKHFQENPKLSDFLMKRATLAKIMQSGQTTLVLDANEFDLLELLRDAVKAIEPPKQKSEGPAGDKVSANQTPERGR